MPPLVVARVGHQGAECVRIRPRWEGRGARRPGDNLSSGAFWAAFFPAIAGPPRWTFLVTVAFDQIQMYAFTLCLCRRALEARHRYRRKT